jgi:hypothetical protein
MPEANAGPETLIDYITGRQVPNLGAEANRQAVERFLVENKGYAKSDIEVGAPIRFTVSGTPYASRVDLVISSGGRRMMVVKCAPGSLGSREREALAAARLLDECQIPLAMVSDGERVTVLDALSGKTIGHGWQAVPCAKEMAGRSADQAPVGLSSDRRAKEMLIFRSYDSMNVNVAPIC